MSWGTWAGQGGTAQQGIYQILQPVNASALPKPTTRLQAGLPAHYELYPPDSHPIHDILKSLCTIVIYSPATRAPPTGRRTCPRPRARSAARAARAGPGRQVSCRWRPGGAQPPHTRPGFTGGEEEVRWRLVRGGIGGKVGAEAAWLGPGRGLQKHPRAAESALLCAGRGRVRASRTELPKSLTWHRGEPSGVSRLAAAYRLSAMPGWPSRSVLAADSQAVHRPCGQQSAGHGAQRALMRMRRIGHELRAASQRAKGR